MRFPSLNAHNICRVAGWSIHEAADDFRSDVRFFSPDAMSLGNVAHSIPFSSVSPKGSQTKLRLDIPTQAEGQGKVRLGVVLAVDTEAETGECFEAFVGTPFDTDAGITPVLVDRSASVVESI